MIRAIRRMVKQPIQRAAALLPSSLTDRLPMDFKSRLGFGFDRWEYEAAFWDYWFRNDKKGPYHNDYKARTTPERRKAIFPAFLDPQLAVLGARFPAQRLKALDVGSGPISVLLWGHDAGLFELTCIDPLAADYARLFAKYGIAQPLPVLVGLGEEMDYSQAYHLVFARNALDHCLSPSLVLRNMVEAAIPGGLVVICSAVDEGTAQSWSGTHQHDIDLEGADLTVTNRHGAKEVPTRTLPITYVWSQRVKRGRGRFDWFNVVYGRL
jgi:hypothetical protein